MPLGMWRAQRLGRHLAFELRTRMLYHLPRIRDSYFASRLVNDLAERGHALATLHRLPELTLTTVALVLRILLVALGLCWLLPQHVLASLLLGGFALGLPCLLYPFVREQDMRVRTHASAAGQLYLDSLRGTEAVAAHGAASAVAMEHEARVLNWHRALHASGVTVIALETLALLLLAALAAYLVWQTHATHSALGVVLLTAYWALFMPGLSRQLLLQLRELPALRNAAARVFEILDAPAELPAADGEPPLQAPDAAKPQAVTPVAVTLRDVTVSRSEQPVLRELTLSVAPGEQIAVAGHSGSGKSSFFGLLLGWLQAQQGEFLLDGEAATPLAIARLRESTVVIDADLYLWNRSIFDNLVFGARSYRNEDVDVAVTRSELQQDLPRYPDGLAHRSGKTARACPVVKASAFGWPAASSRRIRVWCCSTSPSSA